MFNSIFNFLDNSKNKNSHNNFIGELQNYFSKIQSINSLKSLHPLTILTCAEIDKNFATCFDYNTKQIYYLPLKMIKGNLPVPGDAIKIIDNNFCVDYTAIFTEKDFLEEAYEECKNNNSK